MLRAVDLDLDVVRGPTGRVWVDDEDEFADAPGAPSATPTRSPGWRWTRCDRVQAAVTAGDAPYDGSAQALAGAAGRPPRLGVHGLRDPARRARRCGATGADPQRADQARTGQPALEPARLALERLRDVLPEDHARTRARSRPRRR